ncbi:sigma-70 family RNA polymerase sigma factor [Gemmata sp. JC673]|uniref:Sigma-70 family RNA polymerase sigma factor n=1 Tax=Gemmata algarum TaxID=2975278 RepID=A0ABU5F6K4_9BACT|nr:sigma-70 family RNA polymerase sigma factor [Gemmata algarum]MDY3562981.1 sigma-70 family RNA polymerase sigma factor [Gemmata algarum]
MPAPDRNLIDRFLRERDEAAFTELVRRYGPVVWGACRRTLANTQDAEDAFQATFLVLLRRAAKLDRDTPLGPWLYRVAALTARNVVRANRRRAAVNGPMEHEPLAPADPNAERLDLDAALLALSERERAAVVLCHLQGFTRREAAERLGCPEGTLSARLNRALTRLRARLGTGAPAALAAGGAALPAGLARATTRSASVVTMSRLAAPGLSPAVAQLADGVLHMFWMKKMMTAAAVLVLLAGAGVFTFGTAGRTSNAARATEPLAAPAPPPASAEDQKDARRIDRLIANLEKQRMLLGVTLENLKAEKMKLEEANAALELGKDIEVFVSDKESSHPLVVREVVNGRAAEVTCRDLDSLTAYLRRAHADPQGPKGLRIIAYKDHAAEELREVFTACAVSGFAKASFGQVGRPSFMMSTKSVVEMANKSYGVSETRLAPRAKLEQKPDEIDLRQYAAPKK